MTRRRGGRLSLQWGAVPGLVFAALLLLPSARTALAGGARVVGPSGTPYTWPVGAPVRYQIDLGFLGTLSNARASQLVQEAFATLQGVDTASITFQSGGYLQADVREGNWPLTYGLPGDGLSPVVFDNDGRILDHLLGLTAREDIEGATRLDLTAGTSILEASILINGACFDGDAGPGSPCELADVNEVRAMVLHAAGHFVNLDHSDLNRPIAEDGDPVNDAVVPTMYPMRVAGEGTRASLNLDDVIALSRLYPTATFLSSGAGLEGRVFADNSVDLVDGANVTARNIDDPAILAVTSVSGDTGGSGAYRFAGLPPGNYTIEVSPIASAFTGRLSVGVASQSGGVPLTGPAEYLSPGESADASADDPDARTVFALLAGTALTDQDFILNNLASLPSTPDPGNNAPLTATPLADEGDTVGGVIAPGDVDYFSISTAGAERIVVDVDAADPDLGSSLQALIGLFDQAGSPLPASMIVSRPDPGTGESGADPAYEIVSPAPAGVATLVIAVTSAGDGNFDGAGGTTSGPYYLRVSPRLVAVASQPQIGGAGGVATGGSGPSAIVSAGGIAPGPTGNGSALDGSIGAGAAQAPPLPDADRDGVADIIDPCPTSPDADGDDACDAADNCLAVYNPYQEDGDQDAAGDRCDAPAVALVNPQDGSELVPLAASVEVRFTEPMDLTSLAAPGGVVLTGPGGAPVPAMLSVAANGRSVTLDPVAILTSDVTHLLAVAGSVIDRDTPPRPVSFGGAAFRTTPAAARPSVAADEIGTAVEGGATSGAASGDRYGAAVDAEGNIDGDLYGDLLIGAPLASGGAAGSGVVHLRLGGAGAAGGAGTTIEFIGAEAGDEAGRSVAFVGDVNGDGLGDLLVGAPAASPVGAAGTGAAYLVFGRSDFASAGGPIDLSSIASPSCQAQGACGVIFRGADPNDRAGEAVSFAGDINDDGRLDILIGAPGRGNGVRLEAGAVYLIFGGAGLQAAGSLDLADVGGSIPGIVYLGEGAGDGAGAAISDWRDRTADGVDDLLIGSPRADVVDANLIVLMDAGVIYAIHGAAAHPSGSVDLAEIGITRAGMALVGGMAGARAGSALSGHRDVTGDGDMDLLAGAPGLVFSGEGQSGAGVLVQSEALANVSPVGRRPSGGTYTIGPGGSAVTTLGAVLFRGEGAGDEAGAAIRGAGDLSGDGIEDLLVGAPGADATQPALVDAGRVYLVLGQPSRPGGEIPLAEVGLSVPGVVLDGRTASGRLGSAVGGGGDIDGTGGTEIVMGAPGDSGGTSDPGRVYTAVPYVAGEATDLTAAGRTTVTLEWRRASGATRHAVYRGSLSTLGAQGGVRTSSGICLTAGLTTDSDADLDGRPDLVDANVPATGTGYWYLTGGVNSLGHGTLGGGSLGVLRRNDAPCF